MFREIWKFLVLHRWHLLLALPGFFLVTVLHESSHAVAVLSQGGTVLEFSVIPRNGELGHVLYKFPDGQSYSRLLIAVAPYLLWMTITTGAFLFASLRGASNDSLGTWIFPWLFVLPLGDIANTAFPYLSGQSNDFLHAFGKPNFFIGAIILLVTLWATVAGFFAQRNLYPKSALHLPAYSVLTITTLLAIATSGRFVWLGL
jgi:hypothetical protein